MAVDTRKPLPPLPPGAPGRPKGTRYRQQYGVIVICDHEEHQARVYNDLRARGATLRVVVT